MPRKVFHNLCIRFKGDHMFPSSRIHIETFASVILASVTAGAVAAFYYAHFFNWPLAEEYIYISWYRIIFHEHGDLAQFLLAYQGPHPMVVVGGVAVGLLWLFGPGITVLTIANYLLMLAAALLLAWRVSRDLHTAALRATIWPLMVILCFHAIQTDSLLKPADLGWLIVSFLLVVNAVAMERFNTPLAAAPGAVIGAFCFAQGSLLSLIAAMHSLLMPGALKARTAGAAGFATMFAATALFVIRKQFGPSDSMDAVDLRAGIVPLLVYGVDLLGSLFGTRSPALLLVLGCGLLLTAAILTLRLPRTMLPSDRIALCLMGYALLAVGMFAAGRYRFGLPWALARFHAAAFVAPFATGLAILAVREMDRRERIGWGALALVLASVISALPYGFQRAGESKQQREAAMTLSCQGHLPPVMVRSLNGVPLEDPEVEDDLPDLRSLCGQPISNRTKAMLPVPTAFATRIAADASAQAPLETLWLTYLHRFDLQQAMPFERPDTPQRLLDWAREEARAGGTFHLSLKAHQAYLRALPAGD
ncbi:MAG: hypothetical protein JSS43_12180 [Proteobacteria bacterium]|nr:hypothetical protein [Pseudomonadota bacterium]